MLSTFQAPVHFKHFVWIAEHVLRNNAARCSQYENPALYNVIDRFNIEAYTSVLLSSVTL